MDRDLQATTTGPHGLTPPPDPGTSVTWDEWRPPPPTAARSVPLVDLLTIASLTPAQAVLVTADLLHATGANPPERVHPVLRTDGAVDLSEVDREIPSVPLRDLLDELVRDARRLPAHPHQHQVRLLHQLEEQVAAKGDPAERGTALRGALTEVAGVGAVTRTRRELVALVEAFNGIAISRSSSSVRVNGHPVAVSPIPRPVSPRVHERVPRQLTRRRRRSRRMLVILGVLVLAAVAAGYVLLRGPVKDLVDDVRGNNSSTTGTNQPPPPSNTAGHHHHQQAGHAAGHHPTFPKLAPQSNAPVQGVSLQKINSCAAGTTCGVTVTVHLTPSGVSQAVGWRVGVMKNCARPTTWSPVTTVTAQPGWSQVFAPSSVQVPKGQSLALVAVTSTPKHAQSRPIPVAGTPLHC